MSTNSRASLPALDGSVIEAIACSLGDRDHGLSHTVIGRLLAECGIPDVSPGESKWKRLNNAFVSAQHDRWYGNHVVGFINKSMKPARWLSQKPEFEDMRAKLSSALGFAGLQVREDGAVTPASVLKTLSDASARASSLRSRLLQREVHPDILTCCKAELLEDNYFHAVLEASKSVSKKLREMSGLNNDGAALAKDALGLGKSGLPLIAINGLSTDTERSEQKGFSNLLIGVFGMFRNPTAHAPKVDWAMSEQDALDILSTISLAHRKLDQAKPARP